MSVRLEWTSAEQAGPALYGSTDELPDGQTAEYGANVLLVGASAIEGTPDELRAMLTRGLAALDVDELRTVVHRWTTSAGDCYDCGNPAAYIVPDAYGEKDITPEHHEAQHKLCGVCAAYHAAVDGERIVYLFEED